MRVTEDMIEAAAIAIRETFAAKMEAQLLQRLKPWTTLPSSQKAQYRAEARAALEAALGKRS